MPSAEEGGGGGSKGVVSSDAGVDSVDDDSTMGSDTGALLSGAESAAAVRELASSGVIAACLGSGKASSPRS